MSIESLCHEIKGCTICAEHLELGVRPVLSVSAESRIIVIGQAPGIRVHKSGIPWDDPSGKRLREWLDVSEESFYDVSLFGIVPMGFCYPGRGKSGDLAPRKECAPKWHDSLMNNMPRTELILLIGQYAQQYYLSSQVKKNLTETVRSFEEYLPRFMVLPHPSPRNNIWLKKNAWFESLLVPVLRQNVQRIIEEL